jgi:hypothetical protein
MTRFRRQLVPFLALALVLSARTLRAQATATTGQIEGTVSDATGAALPAVSVMARNAATGFERTAVSDATGFYRLSLLPLGTYEVSAQLQGFAGVKRSGLALRVGETLTAPFSLKVASVEESVTVTAEAPAVEVTRSLSANNVNQTAIESLPINGRRFQDFVLLTPGAVVENQRGGTAIGGQRGINASYAIDGADYDNPFFGGIKGGERSGLAYTISQEAIQEFQVSNAGYNAEFGRSGGGVVNAVTKSGTNDIHGSLFYYFRNEGLTSDNPDALVSAGYAPKSPVDFKQQQFGASLGGPIQKDKAHFFVAYDQQLRTEPITVKFSSNPSGVPGFDGQEGTFDRTNDVWTALARVDYNLNSSNHFWIRYNYSKNQGENGLVDSQRNLNDAVSYNGLEGDSTHTVVAQLSSVVSATALNEVRFQFAREDRPREPNTTDVTVNVTGMGRLGRVTFLPSLETDDRYQILDNFTLLRGAHSIRLGFDANFIHTAQPFFLSRSGGEYRFNSVADYLTTVNTGVQKYRDFRQGFGRADVDFWNQELALYLQDTWKARKNLTVNYGLRYEAQFNPTPDQPNPALPGSDKIVSDTNNFGPRFGVAWDPWNDGKGVIRANAGYFFARTPSLLFVSPFTSNGQAQLQLTFTPTTHGAPIFPNILSEAPSGASGPRSDANVFAPDFGNPRILQVSTGLEREVVSNLNLGVDYVYSRGYGLERLFDVNISPASGTAADGRLIYRNARPNARFNRILQAQSTAKSEYNAFTLSVKRRFTAGDHWYNKGLQFQAFYTWSKSKDDDSNERNFSGLFYQDFQNLGAEYTYSNNDVRHNFVANATWNLASDVQFGVIFAARSGLPYSHLANQDLNFDGDFGNDRQFIGGIDTGRNTYRQASYKRLDVRLSKAIRLGGRKALDLSVDVFNLLNSDNLFVTESNRNFLGAVAGTLNPNLDRPNAQVGDPRTAQLSARFRF